MLFNFNEEIESVLSELGVPVSFMFYDGNATTYVTYMQLDKDNALAGDDELIGCVQYYDFDVYSKGNYLNVISNLIDLMQAAGGLTNLAEIVPICTSGTRNTIIKLYV